LIIDPEKNFFNFLKNLKFAIIGRKVVVNGLVEVGWMEGNRNQKSKVVHTC
jgi:hypothetical protein